MAQNKDAERNEKLFEAMLKVALEETVNKDMEAFPSQEELDKMFPRSAAMDERVMKIISPPSNESKHRKAARIFVRVAASFAIMFTVGVIALMSVEASRNFILNYIIEMRDDHVVFDFGVAEPMEGDRLGLLEFLPEGFEYTGSSHFEFRSAFIYVNEVTGEQIILQQQIGENLRVAVDNENREFTIWDIDNRDVYVFEALDNESGHVILWAEGEYVFNIVSTVDLPTLLDIVGKHISR